MFHLWASWQLCRSLSVHPHFVGRLLFVFSAIVLSHWIFIIHGPITFRKCSWLFRSANAQSMHVERLGNWHECNAQHEQSKTLANILLSAHDFLPFLCKMARDQRFFSRFLSDFGKVTSLLVPLGSPWRKSHNNRIVWFGNNLIGFSPNTRLIDGFNRSTNGKLHHVSQLTNYVMWRASMFTLTAGNKWVSHGNNFVILKPMLCFVFA